jgi:hypothetical protein
LQAKIAGGGSSEQFIFKKWKNTYLGVKKEGAPQWCALFLFAKIKVASLATLRTGN